MRPQKTIMPLRHSRWYLLAFSTPHALLEEAGTRHRKQWWYKHGWRKPQAAAGARLFNTAEDIARDPPVNDHRKIAFVNARRRI